MKTSFTTGLTLMPSKELFVLAAPFSYNLIFGKKSHHLELGIGLTFMRIKRGKINVEESYKADDGVVYKNAYIGSQTMYYSYITPKLGYRFQKPAGGIFFRATLTPPIAGINKIGHINESKFFRKSEYEYFTSAAIFEGYKMFPWAGISLGYTLK